MKTADYSNLSERVKKARAYANMSQAELARRLGVTQQAVSKVEKKNRHCEFVYNIAIVTGVDVHWMHTGSGEMIVKQNTFIESDIIAIDPALMRKAIFESLLDHQASGIVAFHGGLELDTTVNDMFYRLADKQGIPRLKLIAQSVRKSVSS